MKGTLGTIVFGMTLGVIGWGGFNWSLELTNTEQFCISCHEMEDNVYQELQETVHWSNRTGVRATCPDCHVPKEWGYKVMRKIKASNELLHKMLGTIDTPEKFEEYRLTMAMSEWKRMKSSNSRECRNCHAFKSMSLDKQQERSADRHDPFVWAELDGHNPDMTCIDCHKGIAHRLPAGWEEAVNNDPILRVEAAAE
ncbi:MAG: NapC/NirT family cytochrome c [Gammaproteobacteria bacterium]|nr:NapC/NirT family cytochrome c [Gammaproteobacteria bacterium]